MGGEVPRLRQSSPPQPSWGVEALWYTVVVRARRNWPNRSGAPESDSRPPCTGTGSGRQAGAAWDVAHPPARAAPGPGRRHDTAIEGDDDALRLVPARPGGRAVLVLAARVQAAARLAPGYADSVHNHRYHFCTTILCGGYVHQRFDTDVDPESGLVTSATLVRGGRCAAGESGYLLADEFHRIPSALDGTMTLLVKSRPVTPTGACRSTRRPGSATGTCRSSPAWENWRSRDVEQARLRRYHRPTRPPHGHGLGRGRCVCRCDPDGRRCPKHVVAAVRRGSRPVPAPRATTAVPRLAPRELRARQVRGLRAPQRGGRGRRGDRGPGARRQLPGPPQLGGQRGARPADGHAGRGRCAPSRWPSGSTGSSTRPRCAPGTGTSRWRRRRCQRRGHVVQGVPVTPVVLAHRYIEENGVSLRELATKIVGEQRGKHDAGYYFYNAEAAQSYSGWAEANLRLWQCISESLDDDDVSALLETVKGSRRPRRSRGTRRPGLLSPHSPPARRWPSHNVRSRTHSGPHATVTSVSTA